MTYSNIPSYNTTSKIIEKDAGRRRTFVTYVPWGTTDNETIVNPKTGDYNLSKIINEIGFIYLSE